MILAFCDTSTEKLYLAVKNNNFFSESIIDTGFTHTENLAKIFDFNINLNKVDDVNKIYYIILGKGPGSFTGIRIAYSFFKGLAATNNIKFIELNTLFLNYISIVEKRDDTLYIPMIYGKKNRYFSKIYFSNNNFDSDDSNTFDLSLEDLLKKIELVLNKNNHNNNYINIDNNKEINKNNNINNNINKNNNININKDNNKYINKNNNIDINKNNSNNNINNNKNIKKTNNINRINFYLNKKYHKNIDITFIKTFFKNKFNFEIKINIFNFFILPESILEYIENNLANLEIKTIDKIEPLYARKPDAEIKKSK